MTLWFSRVTRPASEGPVMQAVLREVACALPLTAAVYVASGSVIAGVAVAVVAMCLRRLISAARGR